MLVNTIFLVCIFSYANEEEGSEYVAPPVENPILTPALAPCFQKDPWKSYPAPEKIQEELRSQLPRIWMLCCER